MKLESTAFKHNDRISPKYTCDGDNVNPSLKISDIPQNAKSLALIMDDPDAPMGTWVHWTIWNIDPKISSIAENSIPSKSTEGITSFKSVGYGGPCPPSGTHRYFFKLYALDTTLSLQSSSDKKKLEDAMKNHILAETQLIGLYSRK
ncbi:MAG: YbhB/YbcL family Raf kinase inhibitor-like protein [Deltaproteobacteria bacterium]